MSNIEKSIAYLKSIRDGEILPLSIDNSPIEQRYLQTAIKCLEALNEVHI